MDTAYHSSVMGVNTITLQNETIPYSMSMNMGMPLMCYMVILAFTAQAEINVAADNNGE